MSTPTPIWDGRVSAAIGATLCDRCSSRDRCVALFHGPAEGAGSGIDLCIECFSELTTQVYMTILEVDGRPPSKLRPAVQLNIDFIARLADAWDGNGNWTLRAHAEHRALLDIAGLSPELCKLRWAEFPGAERHALLLAARRAIEFGRQCAWVLGEGEGARF